MKWYKHDSDANMDGKLQEVLLDYGLEGYGLYWYCLELITSKVDADNVTFKLEHDCRIIARNTGCTPQRVQEMMNRFVELGLFENSAGIITCLKLSKRIDKSMTSSPIMRGIIGKLGKNHDLVMTQSCKPMQDKTRLDKIRLDKDTLPSPKEDDRPEQEEKIPLPRKDTVPYQKILDLYHKNLPDNPRVKILSPSRKSAIKSRWMQDEKFRSLEFWEKLLSHTAKSDFLTGKIPPTQGRKQFVAGLDFIVSPTGFVGIIEGKYDN